MEIPEPSKNLPSGKWFTVQVGMVKHTTNLAHIVQLTSGATGNVTIHLSSGEQIGLGVEDSVRLLDEMRANGAS